MRPRSILREMYRFYQASELFNGTLLSRGEQCGGFFFRKTIGQELCKIMHLVFTDSIGRFMRDLKWPIFAYLALSDNDSVRCGCTSKWFTHALRSLLCPGLLQFLMEPKR